MMPLNDTTTLHKGQHLALTERIEIQTLKRQGLSNRRIAKELNRSHSTINDEIKRGWARQKKILNGQTIYSEDYYAETGQLVYERSRQACLPKFKLLKVDRFIQYAKEQIKDHKWSPDIIVGRVIKDGLFDAHERVCAKTLYAYIDAGLIELNNMDLWLKLQRNTKPKRVRENKRNLGKSIEERPSEINDRTTFGHWEIDTIVGKKTKDQPVLLTMTERLTRYTLVIKIQGKHEAAVNETIRSLSQDNPHFPHLFKSITSDNGSEFAGLSETLSGLSDVYFAHPYASWERGANEKHNGILRRFIPKGKSLKDYTVQQIKQMMHWMNHLPRKILNYQTPTESILFHFNQIQGTNGSLVTS